MNSNTTVGRETTLWSLRPAGEHAGLRRTAQGAGLRLRALSMQRLSALPADAASEGVLRAALAASIRVWASPAAVRFGLRSLASGAPPRVAVEGIDVGVDIGVGEGTASALRRAGAREVICPERMDSEGVLALPALANVATAAVGLVTAPGGRGMLAAALRERGADLRVAEIYARVALHGGARRIADFIDDASGVLLVSSAEALDRLLARLPPATTARGLALRRRLAVASSARLVQRLGGAGFASVVQAAGPRPAQLVEAACTPHP